MAGMTRPYSFETLIGFPRLWFRPAEFAREIAAYRELGSLLVSVRSERSSAKPAARNAATQAAMRHYAAANYR